MRFADGLLDGAGTAVPSDEDHGSRGRRQVCRSSSSPGCSASSEHPRATYTHRLPRSMELGSHCGDASLMIPTMLALPYILRLVQCLRVVRSTRDRHQLINAFKYASSLPVILLSAAKYHVTEASWSEFRVKSGPTRPGVSFFRRTPGNSCWWRGIPRPPGRHAKN